MRSRAVNNDQSRLDDKELSNDIEEAEIKSSSSSRRYDSVGENSYYFSSMMTKNPWVLLCLGIFFGVFLSLSINKSHAMMKEPIEGLHRNVQSAYRAHNVARKEYLRSYREAYLDSILAARGPSSSSSSSSSPEMGNVVEDTETSILLQSSMEKVEVNDIPRRLEFKTLENGKHVCLPLIDEENSDLVVEIDEGGSGSLISKADCEWLNELIKAGIEVAKTPSSCVQDDFLFATLTNDKDWKMLEYGLHNVKNETCFLDRILLLCLDDKAVEECKDAGYKHCVPYIRSFKESRYGEGDFGNINWMKEKMRLALLGAANLSLFTFDADIIFFKVPDLAKVVASDRDAELFHQWEKVDYEALYSNRSFDEDREKSILHEGFNGGQILSLPTPNVIKGTMQALRNGIKGSKVTQDKIRDGLKAKGAKIAGLSYMYAQNWLCETKRKCFYDTNSQNWINYHATWVVGFERKMEVLKKAQEGWSKLYPKPV